MSDKPISKADADALRAQLAESLNSIAASRQEARKLGLEIPENLRQMIYNLRQQFREAGMSQNAIDATPGLEPFD
jgi:hypothetical protein